MIREILIPVLEERFSGRGMRVGAPPDPIVIFPAAHIEVGNVSIWDDGDEATVAIGDITHGHFNPYDSTLADDQIARDVTEMVVGFLDALFADKVLLWCSEDRRSGGWRVLDERVATAPRDLPPHVYVWSGPLEPKMA